MLAGGLSFPRSACPRAGGDPSKLNPCPSVLIRGTDFFFIFPLIRSAYVRIISKGVGEKSHPKEKFGWHLQAKLVGASYRKAWHGLAQPGRGRNRTENRRNTEMQKHKKTKRTHFPPFSTKNAHSQNEPIWRRTPKTYLFVNSQLSISPHRGDKTNPFFIFLTTPNGFPRAVLSFWGCWGIIIVSMNNNGVFLSCMLWNARII
jgi:hypothetical protein